MFKPIFSNADAFSFIQFIFSSLVSNLLYSLWNNLYSPTTSIYESLNLSLASFCSSKLTANLSDSSFDFFIQETKPTNAAETATITANQPVALIAAVTAFMDVIIPWNATFAFPTPSTKSPSPPIPCARAIAA